MTTCPEVPSPLLGPVWLTAWQVHAPLSWRGGQGMTVWGKIRQMKNELGCGDQDVSTHWTRQSQGWKLKWAGLLVGQVPGQSSWGVQQSTFDLPDHQEGRMIAHINRFWAGLTTLKISQPNKTVNSWVSGKTVSIDVSPRPLNMESGCPSSYRILFCPVLWPFPIPK